MGKVRDQLDDIAQLDMGKINAVGDFFGKDSSFKTAMEELASISEEMGKIHSIAAGAAAAIARLSKRGKGEEMDSENLKDKGLMDSTGFFKKSNVEFKDILKQVERSAKDNLPGAMGKLGGFFKGMVKGAKAKPLFGLNAEDITMAVSNAKGSAFNTIGEKIVSLGNDISKFGESMAKYKSKEKELQKAARKEKKDMEKTAKAAAAMAATDIVGRDETISFGDRIKGAKGVVSDEQKDSVEASMVALSDEFSKLKAENKRYSMDFLLETLDEEAGDAPDDGEEPADDSASGSEEFYDELDDKIVDELIDTVDGIETSDAEKIADKMLEGKNRVNHNKEFYRLQKLAGFKGQ